MTYFFLDTGERFSSLTKDSTTGSRPTKKVWPKIFQQVTKVQHFQKKVEHFQMTVKNSQNKSKIH